MMPIASIIAIGTLSGVLYSLSIPAADFHALAWICLTPLFVMLGRRDSSRMRGRMLLAACLSGVAAGVGRIYWISDTLIDYGGLSPLTALGSNVGLILYLALYPTAFLAISSRFRLSGPFFPLLSAAVWVLLDWVQNWLLTGFAWMSIGYALHLNKPILQLASVTGVYGLSFAVVAVNAAIAQLLVLRNGAAVWRLAGMALLIGGVAAAGSHRIRAFETENPETLRVGIVQGNVPQGIKWRRDRVDITTTRYVDLTRQLVRESSSGAGPLDLIVFPETALPFYLTDPAHSSQRQRIAELAVKISTPILVGSLEGRLRDREHPIYNRAYLINRSGDIVASADKVHLVPFGEYLPLPLLFNYLEELTAESGRFTPGRAHTLLELPHSGTRLGIFICFESIFPGIPRTLARLGADLLINTTNDAWFGDTSAPYQHMAMAVVRAVETGRPLVRVANTGISAVVTPDGSVLRSTQIFATETLAVEVPITASSTLYSQYGDSFLWLCVGLLAVAAMRHHHHYRLQCEAARVQLEEFAGHPQPLPRPLVLFHGYDSSAERWGLVSELHRCFSDAASRLYLPDLNRNQPLAEMGTTEASWSDDEPVDCIGHSLGGLAACQHVLARGSADSYIYALATPFHGTWAARMGRLMRWRFPLLLADLVPGSSFLKRLRTDEITARVTSFRIAGDPVISSRSACLTGCVYREYTGGCDIWLPRRHRAVHSDPRIIRDIIADLRARGRE